MRPLALNPDRPISLKAAALFALLVASFTVGGIWMTNQARFASLEKDAAERKEALVAETLERKQATEALALVDTGMAAQIHVLDREYRSNFSQASTDIAILKVRQEEGNKKLDLLVNAALGAPHK